jgi:hypothetical protein
VLEQAAEAAVGAAGQILLAGGLGLGPGGAAGLVGPGGVSSVKVSGAQAWRRCQLRCRLIKVRFSQHARARRPAHFVTQD